MHNKLKSVVEFPNLKSRPKFLCIKKKKKKRKAPNLGLSHMCDLLFGDFPCGTKQRCLHATEPGQEKPRS